MKICWDNLEKLEYIPDKSEWMNKHRIFYVYKDSCKICSEPFLARKYNNSKYCGCSCSNSDRYYSEDTKKKMSISAKKRLENPKNHPSWKGGYHTNNIPMFDTYAPQISFCEEVKRNKQDQNILEVKCAYCGKWFIPTKKNVVCRIGAINGKYTDKTEYRFYCSDNCKKECPVYKQKIYPKGFKPATSREVQPQLRQLVFERDSYICQKCGKSQDELDVGLHCHHLTGVVQNPIESADIDNCITLCKNCHKIEHQKPGMRYHELRCK